MAYQSNSILARTCCGLAEGVHMRTRREFLTSLFGAGTVGLIVACGGAAQQPSAATSAPAAKPTTAGAAPTQAAAGPTQAAPAQAAGKPSAAGGQITFALENEIGRASCR